jgi:hypothetical protein
MSEPVLSQHSYGRGIVVETEKMVKQKKYRIYKKHNCYCRKDPIKAVPFYETRGQDDMFLRWKSRGVGRGRV